MILRRIFYGLILAGFLIYTLRFAPPDTGHDATFQELMLGRGLGRNPAIFAVFNLLGILPLLYWALLFPDGRGQKVWAWPFAFGMMALGSFALLPYFILRRPYPVAAPGAPGFWVRWFGSRAFALFADSALVFLIGYGLVLGDWGDYAYWFRHSNFINVMTVDLALLALLFPALLTDDLSRRGISGSSPLGRAALFVPIIGPAIYLVLRRQEGSL